MTVACSMGLSGPAVGSAMARPAGDLACSHRQIRLLRNRPRLRDQPLQFRNAGAAIGARLQLRADLGGAAGAGRDGIAKRVAADTEAGADDLAAAFEPVGGFARQPHPALILADG